MSKISAPEELKNTTGTVKEMAEVSTTASQIIKSICKNEGVVGFYRGLTASVLRQLTYSSGRFNTYFYLKNKFTDASGNISLNIS